MNGTRRYLDHLLGDTAQELCNLLERGLEGATGDDLSRLGTLLESAGMERGAQLARELERQLASARLTRNGDHTQEALSFARLWQYLSLCRDRLGYHQIMEELQPQKETTC